MAQGLALVALTLCCYGLALVVSQLTVTGRAAAGIGAAFLGALFLVAGAARNGGLEAVAPLSPFWQYERSQPLVSGGSIDGASVAWLLRVAGIATVVAALHFVRRDLGASALPQRVSRSAAVRVHARRPRTASQLTAPSDAAASGNVRATSE